MLVCTDLNWLEVLMFKDLKGGEGAFSNYCEYQCTFMSKLMNSSLHSPSPAWLADDPWQRIVF